VFGIGAALQLPLHNVKISAPGAEICQVSTATVLTWRNVERGADFFTLCR